MAHEDDLKQVGAALQLAGAALARLSTPAAPEPRVITREPVLNQALVKAETEGPEAGAGKDKDTAVKNPPPTQPAPEDPKSLFWDPFAIVEQLGYKDRPSQLTYGTLKAMAWKTPVLHAVINARVQQVAAFCRPQHDRYQIGFRIKLRDTEKEPTKAEREWMKQMETLITRTGVTKHPRGRDNFETFLRKITWDSLVYDQLTFEVIENKKGEPCEWYAVDSSTMRLADTASTFMDEDLEQAIKFVQIYDGQVIAEFNQNELCFGIRNPRTDIRLFGYGVSELEMLVPTVTSLLWGFEYNQRFFCIRRNTLVTTRAGLETGESLVDTEFEIWDGTQWEKARAFDTGLRSISKTVLWNGLEIETSPEHRFRVIPENSLDGLPEWREQQELVSGDCLLVDCTPVDPPIDASSFRFDRRYETDRSTGRAFTPTKALVEDSEFWEMLGFALGDGYWPDLTRRTAHWLRIFPHYQRDAALFDRFLGVCSRHGIHASKVTVNKHIQRSDGEYGYPCIQIGHRAFLEWLYDLGFSSSTSGKRIAGVLFKQPASIRQALLCGLFSADGCTTTHVTGYRTPTVYSADQKLRQDMLRCLLSVGVAANIVGAGPNRKGTILIQDVDAFVARIGYLQSYKNEGIVRSDCARHRWDKLHPRTARRIARLIQESARDCGRALIGKDASLVSKVVMGNSGMSRPRAIALLRELGQNIPEELGYLHTPVDFLEETGEAELMVDVEVFNDRHVFLANFVATHNSQGTAPKGIINFKGTIPETQLQQFRRHWYQMCSGVENAWRTPVTVSDELQYVNLQQSSRDMEFNAWIDFLIKIACSMYSMDPMEVNFQYGNVGQKQSLQQANNKEKITESRERGLRPLLRFIAEKLNQHIVWPINEAFEFDFVGLDAQTREQIAELNTKRVKTVMTVDEIRAEDDKPPLPDGVGEIILDPVFMQHAQLKAGQAMEAEGGQMGEGEPEVGEEGGGEEGDFERLLAQYEEGEEEEDEEEGGEKEKPEPGKGVRKSKVLVDVEL